MRNGDILINALIASTGDYVDRIPIICLFEYLYALGATGSDFIF
jgi:hypothetical protein